MQSNGSQKILKEDAQVFWGEIAPCDHVVQIYENDGAFLDVLYGFVLGGIRSGESVVLIATDSHLVSINEKLRADGFDPFYLKLKDYYIPLDAAETLSRFIVDDSVDDTKFHSVIDEILERTKRAHRPVRAFGEMVALLIERGALDATVRLEQLWTTVVNREGFCLFCAYPTNSFQKDSVNSISRICSTHSKVVYGANGNSNELLYSHVA